MRVSNIAFNFSIILGLSLVIGCGRKIESTPTLGSETGANGSSGGVSPTSSTGTTSTGTATSVVTGGAGGGGGGGGGGSGPTCFIPTTISSLESMRDFFYPTNLFHPEHSSYQTANSSYRTSEVPHADGDLNICFEYRDSADIVAQLRTEYQYEKASMPANLYLTWMDMKIFNDAANQDWRFFHGQNIGGELELIWFDGLRFVSLTATQTAGENYAAGEIRYASLPTFASGDARGANDAQEIGCRDGSISALNCVANDVYSWEFYRQYVVGNQMERCRAESGTKDRYNNVCPDDGNNFHYPASKPLSAAQKANVLGMVRHMLHPEQAVSGSATLAASLAGLGVVSNTLSTGIAVNLDDARAETINEHP